jgi:hypothetical protein
LDVSDLEGPREGVYDLDAAFLIEEYVPRPHIPQSFSNFCRLFPSPEEAEKKVPKLDLGKARLLTLAVVDFFCEEVREIVVVDLSKGGVTVAVPVCPHMPVREKAAVRGRRRLAGIEAYLAPASRHLSYSFSSTANEVCRRFS